MKSKNFDWIIIGSGAGGSVAAHELAMRFGESVALLESGKPLTDHPKDSAEHLYNNYKGAGLHFIPGSPPLSIGEAHCLGGGPSINSRIYHRLPDAIKELWAKDFQQKNLSEDFLSAQNWVEEVTQVKEIQSFTSLEKKLEEGLGSSGFKKKPSRLFGPPTLIDNAVERGLKVFCGVNVTELQRHGDRWEIKSVMNGVEECWQATNIVLAAGAVETPRLLQRSSAIVYFHPQVRILARFPDSPRPHDNLLPFQFEDSSASYGFSASSERSLCAFASATPESIKKVLVDNKEIYALYASPYDSYSFEFSHARPDQVRFTSSQKSAITNSLKKLQEFLRISGASEWLNVGYGSQWNHPGTRFSDLSLTTVHLMGGIGSGESTDRVCDSEGQVKGTRNLFVADASLLNGPLHVNPQGAIMALVKNNFSALLPTA